MAKTEIFQLAILVFAVYVLLLCIILAFRAGNASLWVDESYSILVSNNSLTGILSELRNDVHPPLYYVLVSVWMRLWGDSELSVRSLSLLLFILSLLAVYKLARLHTGEPETGLYTAWLFAVSYLSLAHATNARSYMLLCFVTILSTYYLIVLTQDDERGKSAAVGYALTVMLGLLSHYSFGYVVLGHLLVTFLLFPGLRMLHIILVGAAAIAFLLCWGSTFLFQWKYAMAIGGAWMKPPSFRTLLEVVTAPFGPAGTTLGKLSTLFYAIAILTPLLPLFRGRHYDKRGFNSGSVVWVVLLASVTLIPVLVSYFKPNFIPHRQGIMAMPFFCLLIARWWSLRLLQRNIVMLLIVLSAGRLLMYGWIAVRSQDDRGTDKWLAKQIIQIAQPGDIVVLSDLSWCPVSYYLNRLGVASKFIITPFPSDIPEHPGWRNLAYYDSQNEIQSLLRRIKTLRKGGAQSIVVALGEGQIYRDLEERLKQEFTLVETRRVPEDALGRLSVFAYRILKFTAK